MRDRRPRVSLSLNPGYTSLVGKARVMANDPSLDSAAESLMARWHIQQWVTAAAVAAALAMAVVGYCAREQRSEAVARADTAHAAAAAAGTREQDAKAGTEKEVRIAALYRAAQSGEALKAADAVTAALLALEGLPDTTSADMFQRDRSHVSEVELALYGVTSRRLSCARPWA